MARVILHSDANSFYASCELVYRPALRGLPMAVCGSTEERHGIVLTATREAKARGVRTAMVNWEARRTCPELIIVPPDYPLYIYFSKRLREMYDSYTDRVEPFGLDECWLDISGPTTTMNDGVRLAAELRRRAKEELGITLSVGVSWNKPYAKLGSDMKKPDATVLLSRDNYRQAVFPCPAEDMIGVGYRTGAKLRSRAIHTLGDLAACPPEYMQKWLGKIGVILQRYAAGDDTSPVMPSGMETVVKSVGNSITAPKDMLTLEDVHCVMFIVAESVAARLREMGMRGRCISLGVRSADMHCFSAQNTVDFNTAQAEDIVSTATEIFTKKGYANILPLRSLGVSVTSLESDKRPVQMDLLGSALRREKSNAASRAVDDIRRRFGARAIERGIALLDADYNAINPKEDHVIHPLGFLRS
ncbi:MAG: DNA polymerase IV [Eubacteriales bacterium]|jgi:DNA polymerase-4|nr:DNA polymerase IV [Eubacteriales bacterium]MDD4105761.1 DNA polymerase IV [Eubacteriales bacterium]MDD4710267.1 DNA polymerase IV [Eubacteriales bacterium]NLO14970.1 DNA polymerase IV [Clostridiales bacterium]